MQWLAGHLRRALSLVAAGGALAAGPLAVEEREVRFDRYDPLASNMVLAQRLLPPLLVDQTFREMAGKHQQFRDQPIDLREESFRIILPARQPEKGYALLVFVSPWHDGRVPKTWRIALARRGMILVAATRSGNTEPVLGRRDPLAVLAAINVMARYKVDPARVYIGGFSGGSKVAFKLAVAYPDLFKGALALAGADSLGENNFVVPSRALHQQFRQTSRIVFLSGASDQHNVMQSDGAAASLQRFCARSSGKVIVPGLNHDWVDKVWFEKALAKLDNGEPVQGGDQTQCMAKLDQKIQAELDAIEALVRSGQIDLARKQLFQLDGHYGGLALPRSLVLLRQIDGV